MIKHSLLVLAAAGLIAMASSSAGAQDSQSNDQPSPPAQGNGHRGAPDPARRTQQLTKQLNLPSDQQSKVQGILESERSQIENLRQDSSVSQQDRHSKMMDIHQSTNTQIRALLDSTQQAKWDKMQANRQQWMQNRHQGQPGGDSGQQAPPPDQPQQ